MANRRPVTSAKKWEPKRWRTEYDIIIAYHVKGAANTAIADKLGFTPEYVSLIINLPEGKRRIEKLTSLVREQVENSVADDLAYIAKKTTERLRLLVDDDEKFEKAPFAIIDRGMAAVKGLGHLNAGNPGGNGANNGVQIGTLVVTNGQKSELLDGLDKLKEVKLLHAGKIKIND